MTTTTLPVSEAKARLNELARRVHASHERVTLTRNGTPEVVMLSVDDLEGLEITLETLADSESLERIEESLAELARGEEGTDVAEVEQEVRRKSSSR